jgi:hypothetical protein
MTTPEVAMPLHSKMVEHPFPHAAFDCFLDEEEAAVGLDWLKNECPWREREEEHYRSSNWHLDPAHLPSPLDVILSREKREEIRTAMERIFGVRLSPSLSLQANKYVAGDGTAVHSDYDPAKRSGQYFFTHRLLWYLNDGWTEEQGGLLGLFEPDSSEPVVLVEPRHNSGAAMAMSDRSLHAVSAQVTGVRYALVFSYTTESGEYQTS